MSSFPRLAIALAAGSALIGLSACSGGSTGGATEGTPAPEPAALKSFDVCSFFTPDELAAAGVSGPGEPDDNLESEPGCNYTGEKMDLTLYKNAETPFGEYMEQGNFGKVERFDAGGRQAATGVTAGSEGQGICSSFLDSGGGTVIITVTGAMRDSVDACGESRKVAEKVSPRLPK